MADDEHITEVTSRIEGLAEQIRKLEAAEKRKRPIPAPVAERRSLYRTIGTVVGLALTLFVLLAALSMILRAGVLG